MFIVHFLADNVGCLYEQTLNLLLLVNVENLPNPLKVYSGPLLLTNSAEKKINHSIARTSTSRPYISLSYLHSNISLQDTGSL